jgi:hypothetical protein
MPESLPSETLVSRAAIAAGAVLAGAAVAGAGALWATHGGAVFFEMIAAGVALCF